MSFASQGADSNPEYNPAVLQNTFLPSVLPDPTTTWSYLYTTRLYVKASPFADEMSFEKLHSAVCNALEKNTLQSQVQALWTCCSSNMRENRAEEESISSRGKSSLTDE